MHTDTDAGDGRSSAPAASGAGTTVGDPLVAWLSAWQATGERSLLDSLVAAIRPDALRFIARTLERRGIRDPAATDDAFALVLGHLRRLPGTGGVERGVARFRLPSRETRGAPGVAFIRWLCRERSLDVARSRRRRGRRERNFSDLDDTTRREIETRPTHRTNAPSARHADDSGLRQAVDGLDARQRAVIELVLDGKTLAVIGHMLGVSEGTVSRIRTRAITRLRRIMDGPVPPDG